MKPKVFINIPTPFPPLQKNQPKINPMKRPAADILSAEKYLSAKNAAPFCKESGTFLQ